MTVIIIGQLRGILSRFEHLSKWLIFRHNSKLFIAGGNIYALSTIGKVMDEDVMSIENTMQMRQFMQLWMMSGGMVLATVKGILDDGRQIEIPDMPGRDFKAEIIELSASFNEIVSRLK